ncbi:MAG: FecR family protein [Cyclobacteriaceae bacterium]
MGINIKLKYSRYSAQDFANDSFFIRWVKNPDEESDWFWKSFVRNNPSCKTEVERAREFISLLDFPNHNLTEDELSSMRNDLLMALRADKEEQRDQMSRADMGFSGIGNYWVKLAAAVIIIPLISVAIFYLLNRSDNQISSLETGYESGVEKRVNAKGQKSILFLSDGTKVWLNAASKISYFKDFGNQDTRDVYLEGEAFFDVAHNEKKPFIVHTSSIKIKVLGTSFNVKSYFDEKTIETTLVHGKVRIEQSDVKGNRIGDVELKPNQRAVFNKESKIINIKVVVADNSLSWKRERLVFDEESIDNVVLQMERWYNVKIHVKNKGNLDCKLTASIENESLEEVLNLISLAHNIQFSISGSEVFLEGTLCEIE